MKHAKRFFRHLWLDVADARRALPEPSRERLVHQVAQAERRHSGEICLCIEAALPLNCLWPPADDLAFAGRVRERAVRWFGQLGVWDTEHNNGVLIYLLLAERAIEVVADRGLQQHISADQWRALIAQMCPLLAGGQFESALSLAVHTISAQLEVHFALPSNSPNPNELLDRVVLA
jgi:uncharacterized membrane protein